MWFHQTTLLFILFWVFELSESVEPRNPQTKESPVTAGMAELKTILSSVQGSLITSVSLIQDQVDQFSKQHLASLDERLSKIESRLSLMESDLREVREKGSVWDAFREHAASWAELMTSVDSKVDHLSMSQTEQLSSMSGQITSLQTAMGEGLEKIGEQVAFLETQVRSNKEETQTEIIGLLKNIDARLTEMGPANRARARTGHQLSGKPTVAPPCVELKDLVKRSALKVDSIFAILTEDVTGKEIKLNSEKEYTDDGMVEGEDFGVIDEETEHHLIRLFRKIALPFKKATKRLKEMEGLGKKFDGAIAEMTFLVRDAVNDVDRKFNDFFNMTMEMFEHQHHQLESYETSLEGLRQCCSGTTADLSDFKARSVASLDRLDVFLARNLQDQNGERSRQQIRFDTDRIIAAVKDQEKLLVDGFDRCSSNYLSTNVTYNENVTNTDSEVSVTPLTTTAVPSTTATTTTTTSTAPESADQSEASRLILRTCEDLMNAGFLESKVYTLDIDEESNDNGRDFRRRFCDQETSGGGWTVSPNRELFLFVILVVFVPGLHDKIN